ncbi:MAG: hypothetical protein Q9161_006318 [Pseudevernia consocians]
MLSTTLYQMAATILLVAHILHAGASSSLKLVGQPYVQDLNITETSCRGSFWCPKFNLAVNRINLYLQDWISYTMSDFDIYGPGVQIACASVNPRFPPFPPLGTTGYCAYTAGEHLPAAGINGSLIKQKIEELRIYGCFACGSVAISDSGDPVSEGLFKIDWVPFGKVKCGIPGQVVCPPTVPSTDRVGLEQGPRPVLSTFNATYEDGATTLQVLNSQGS